eukprot:PhF_6_TR14002/c0_g1_i1/m.22452
MFCVRSVFPATPGEVVKFVAYCVVRGDHLGCFVRSIFITSDGFFICNSCDPVSPEVCPSTRAKGLRGSFRTVSFFGWNVGVWRCSHSVRFGRGGSGWGPEIA